MSLELKPRSRHQITRFNPQDPRSSFTFLMITWSEVVPRKLQSRTGMPSLVTAMPITTWGRSGRWSFECFEKARMPISSSGEVSSSCPGTSSSSSPLSSSSRRSVSQ